MANLITTLKAFFAIILMTQLGICGEEEGDEGQGGAVHHTKVGESEGDEDDGDPVNGIVQDDKGEGDSQKAAEKKGNDNQSAPAPAQEPTEENNYNGAGSNFISEHISCFGDSAYEDLLGAYENSVKENAFNVNFEQAVEECATSGVCNNFKNIVADAETTYPIPISIKKEKDSDSDHAQDFAIALLKSKSKGD